jgi:hypothetical protein
MTVSESKSSCGVKVILSSRSMVDRRHINNSSVKRRISRSRGEELRGYIIYQSSIYHHSIIYLLIL